MNKKCICGAALRDSRNGTEFKYVCLVCGREYDRYKKLISYLLN